MLRADVLYKVRSHAKAMSTLVTKIRPLSCMRPCVNFELRVGDKGPRTKGASVRTYGCMTPNDMFRKAVLVFENLPAVFALKVAICVGDAVSNILAVFGRKVGPVWITTSFTLITLFTSYLILRIIRAFLLLGLLSLLLLLAARTVLKMRPKLASVLKVTLTTCFTVEKVLSEIVSLDVIHEGSFPFYNLPTVRTLVRLVAAFR